LPYFNIFHMTECICWAREKLIRQGVARNFKATRNARTRGSQREIK
jgi:hypothetical protein